MIKTNCKDCAFAVYLGNNQTSCSFDRLRQFGDGAKLQNDTSGNFYIIDRLCTYYRNKSWGYSLKDAEKVKEESSLSFDIIFDCNNINQIQSQAIHDFIQNHRYYKSRINFFLLHEYSKYDQCKSYINDIASQNRTVNITICENIEFHIHQLALKSKSGYHIYVKNPELLKLDSFQKMDDYVNKNLKKFVLCYMNDHYIISNTTYRLFNSQQYRENNISNYFTAMENIINTCKNSDLYIEL